MNSNTPGGWLLWAGAGMLVSGVQAQENSSRLNDWTRDFRLGMAVGFNIKADFQTGGSFALQGKNPGPAGVSGANHEYDNGYVRVDRSGNAGGYTTYFGYDSPALQYNQTAQTLTYQSANSATIEPNSGHGNDSPYLGLDLAYTVNLKRLRRARLGAELGFGFMPLTIRDRGNMVGTFAQTTHQYNVPSGVRLPTISGYHATLDTIGPAINDVPTDIAGPATTGDITGTRTLDVNLYHFRLGPSLYWDLNRWLSVSAAAGGAVGVVTGDYKFDETAHPTGGGTIPIKGSFGKTDIVYGGYANAMLYYHTQKEGDIFLGAQFMSLSDSTFSSGGRKAKLDLGAGLVFIAGLNWSF